MDDGVLMKQVLEGKSRLQIRSGDFDLSSQSSCKAVKLGPNGNDHCDDSSPSPKPFSHPNITEESRASGSKPRAWCHDPSKYSFIDYRTGR
jgi:hypothetical protein